MLLLSGCSTHGTALPLEGMTYAAFCRQRMPDDRADVRFFEDAGLEPRFRSRLDDYRNSGYDRGHLVSAPSLGTLLKLQMRSRELRAQYGPQTNTSSACNS